VVAPVSLDIAKVPDIIDKGAQDKIKTTHFEVYHSENHLL